jgi:chaperonin GroES
MEIIPLHNGVLVERIEAESKTAGGIIIPDTAKEKPAEGKVIAVGEGNRDDNGKKIPLDVKKGDHILFAKWGGTEVKVNGKELIIIKETDILAIVKKTK